jgi:hypothetical protein
MEEEKYIREKFGCENHFRIPNGYFEDFAANMMNKIPEVEVEVSVQRTNKKSRTIVLHHRIMVAAACVAFMISGLSFYFYNSQGLHHAESTGSVSKSVSPDDAAVQEAADYAMLDNQDIYKYVSSEE